MSGLDIPDYLNAKAHHPVACVSSEAKQVTRFVMSHPWWGRCAPLISPKAKNVLHPDNSVTLPCLLLNPP
jgi:hypothetical protein